MKRSLLAALAAGAAAVVVVPLAATATTAAWNDRQWAHGSVGTSSAICGTTDDFASTASGRFLSGELLGTDLDNIAALEPMRLSYASDGTLDVSPPDAIDLGSTATTATYANPLDISVLGGIVGLDLTGLQVGLPVGSAGAVNQYAQVSRLGQAAGASGLVSNSGGVLVSASTPPADLPEPATISLDTLLPAAAGIADAQLQVGAVAASAQLDGCAALRSKLWGDGSVTGITRDYGVASLGLQLDSPLVGSLLSNVTTTVNSTIGDLQTAIDGLTGSNGTLSQTIAADIGLTLPLGLAHTALTGTVSVTGLNLQNSVASLLSLTTLSDGAVTIDLTNGTIDAELTQLISPGPNGMNNLPPNTELVVDSTVLNAITARVGALLDNWTGQITTALTNAIRGATLAVNLTTQVNLLSGAIPILDLTVALNTTIGNLLDHPTTTNFTVTIDLLGLTPALNILLGPLGLSVSSLTGILNGLASGLITPTINLITSSVFSLVTTLGSTLATLTAPIVTAVGTIVDALPSVVSVMVNVQPDQAGAPPGATFDPGTAHSTPEYVVSALRIGLASFDTPADVAHIVFGTASAGPVAVP
jgi:hypothetical protein